jgi:hypothetical protein
MCRKDLSHYLAVIRAVDFLLGGFVVPGELTGTPPCLLFPVPENMQYRISMD